MRHSSIYVNLVLVTGAVLPVFTSVSLAAGGLPVVRVADTSTVIPSGAFAGKTFGNFQSSGVVAPPVLDQGHLEFIGAPVNSTPNGVFTWQGGASIQLLADSSVPRPDSSTPFSQFRYP